EKGDGHSVLSSSSQFSARTPERRTENRVLRTVLRNYFRSNSLGGKRLDHVADFNVTVIGDRNAALHAVGDLAGIILEAPQRSYLAFEHLYVVAQQAHFGVALDQAIADAATGHGPNLRNAEDIQHLGATLVRFFDRGFEQA